MKMYFSVLTTANGLNKVIIVKNIYLWWLKIPTQIFMLNLNRMNIMAVRIEDINIYY